MEEMLPAIARVKLSKNTRTQSKETLHLAILHGLQTHANQLPPLPIIKTLADLERLPECLVILAVFNALGYQDI